MRSWQAGSLKEGENWVRMLWRTIAGALVTLIGFTGLAVAEPGRSEPWQLGLQEPVTEIARQIVTFHNFLLVIITVVTLFVSALLVYAMVKFSEKNNPTPSTNTHNTALEVAWTVVPILILIVIAIPSFRLLYAQYDFPKADVRVKAIGNQWYWDYEYPGTDVSFSSNMLEDAEAKKQNRPRLLAVDNPVVVPVNKNVEVLITAADVLHNWTVPSFGVKLDAVPGRVLRTWFRADKEGIYYGQCSELCGVRHAFMPIEVRVVSQDVYDKWLAAIKDDEDKALEVLKTAAAELARRRMAEAKVTGKPVEKATK